MADNLVKVVERLEAVASRLEKCGISGVGSNGGCSEEVGACLADFDAFMAGPLAVFLTEAKAMAPEVGQLADMVKQTFMAQREFIALASQSKKPTDAQMATLLQPQASGISKISEFREQNRRSKCFNHLSMVSESIAACNWVVVSPAPAPYVKEMEAAGQFYGNRVIKDDKAHMSFTTAWSAVLIDLQKYVKQHHTTGLSWNPRGGDAGQAKGSGGGAPPPPPPGPPPVAASSNGGDDSAKKAALFEALNQGAGVTKGLRKVTTDMQTHKNPQLRSAESISAKPQPQKSAPTTRFAQAASKTPVCALNGKKWTVDHQVNVQNLVLDKVEMSHVVYIYGCKNSVIKVVGKVNQIVMDTCSRTSVEFDTTLGSAEFINCTSCTMNCLCNVPNIMVDKTDGLQMYVVNEDVKLVSAKSSEINLSIPDGKGKGDFKELAVPEQFSTVICNGKLVTTVSEST